MRGFARPLVLLAALAMAWPSAGHAAPAPPSPLVRVELIADAQSIQPGQTLWVALHQTITPGWHTYWQNPGDSGLPTHIEWKLPAGVTAGPILWPAPLALPAGPLVNYGYEGEVYLPSTLSVPKAASPGSNLAIAARS